MSRSRYRPPREPYRCGICREPGHNRHHCPRSEPDPPPERALPLWPVRLLFHGEPGALELFEWEHPAGEEIVFWRLLALHTHWWRGPAHSRVEALVQAAHACGLSSARADWHLVREAAPRSDGAMVPVAPGLWASADHAAAVRRRLILVPEDLPDTLDLGPAEASDDSRTPPGDHGAVAPAGEGVVHVA